MEERHSLLLKVQGTLKPYLRQAFFCRLGTESSLLLSPRDLSSITFLSKVASHILYPSPLFILADEERLGGLGWLGELGKLAF